MAEHDGEFAGVESRWFTGVQEVSCGRRLAVAPDWSGRRIAARTARRTILVGGIIGSTRKRRNDRPRE
jgi:hypothetical protein